MATDRCLNFLVRSKDSTPCFMTEATFAIGMMQWNSPIFIRSTPIIPFAQRVAEAGFDTWTRFYHSAGMMKSRAETRDWFRSERSVPISPRHCGGSRPGQSERTRGGGRASQRLPSRRGARRRGWAAPGRRRWISGQTRDTTMAAMSPSSPMRAIASRAPIESVSTPTW